ncbi:MAG: glycosyltransferase family 39 protein, partial [Leptospiraceae bacterium]|nr:glycosyltransferase family 39 protein [Leptospiraceae bacterium]
MLRIFFFIFLTLSIFLSNQIYLNDEMLVVLQLKGVESGFEVKIGDLFSYQGTPWFEIDHKKYAPFSYLLPILAYPIYKILLFLNFFGYPDLLLALIPPTGFLILSFHHKKYRIPAIAFFISTILLFEPIYRFEDWAGIYALKLVNLIAISLTAEILYRMLRENVSDRIAISAVIIFIFATPVAYWSLSAKLHALSLLIISLSFYFLDKFLKKEKFRDLFISSF